MCADHRNAVVVVRVKELDDDLIAGIVEVNNDSPVRQGKVVFSLRKDV